jgi:hypothetical protein
MAENLTPQNRQDDELSVEELEGVAGGDHGPVSNGSCPVTNNTGCPSSTPMLPGDYAAQ